MTARKRLRKFALWFGIAIPVLAALYFGAYYRMVTPVNALMNRDNNFYLNVSAYYLLPWPLPSNLNHAPLQQKLQTVFAPAHRLDRSLRPDVWIHDRFEGIGIQNHDGSFTLRDAE